jgi:L-2-hydroxyglutarate oxidase LhgO
MSVCVIGAGILGLATARELTRRHPGLAVTVVDKEQAVGAHQSGHNSCVVHAGLYYEPGSLKATLCRRGGGLLKEYCAEHGITFDEIGKVVVAAEDAELPALRRIFDRATRNGVPDLRIVDVAGLQEIEPWSVGVAALHSPHTATVDFPGVCRQLAADVAAAGGQVLLGQEVMDIRETAGGVEVMLPEGPRRFAAVVACAGLGSDRVARRLSAADGAGSGVRIVPFRGEYWRLTASVRDRVRGLIYPCRIRAIRSSASTSPVGTTARCSSGRTPFSLSPRRATAGGISTSATSPNSPAGPARGGSRGSTGGPVSARCRSRSSKRAFTRAARRYMPSLMPADLVRAEAG